MGSTLAGDFDYDLHGSGYAVQRRADPRIAGMIQAALGDARTVVNVGAGAGSYEPADRYVTAVEPSAGMRAQRPRTAVPAVDAWAEALPFDDDAFDAAMATITVHQWSDLGRGLSELRRVARGPVALLVFDPAAAGRFWLAEYCPELIATEQRRDPAISDLTGAIGASCDVVEVPIPIDCVDGFTEAFYARPERFLDARVRAAQSAWGFVDEAATARCLRSLRDDLDSGTWDARFGHLRTQPEWTGSLRLLVGHP
ncbi:hypothetical protein BJY16_007029 [Actinoplanes octamycinicus]|uniref:Methyltransferase type 11 domain-containing protein n=1 Tax=Actinoplanes octamycinicus TaxID=135948 RepID=A0A7W7H3Y7_9ACTN|nr:methyltransferase domain-containing protein [Actinoplanes octamycinicus]MBB4743570.1 hypothetical protein [Actinoplanes octamycinicus]GIE62440.1 hypothetical protein Aoc01nite_78420 [Actinoplanes octamycinicus]